VRRTDALMRRRYVRNLSAQSQSNRTLLGAELALGITGIGPIGVMPDPVLRRTERGVPPREALSDAA
jgi:hypothetical protein